MFKIAKIIAYIALNIDYRLTELSPLVIIGTHMYTEEHIPNKLPGTVPPSGQISGILRERIRTGDYELGERLAPESDLAKEFSVSRGTVRKALRILERDRLILRQRGRGTFVTNAPAASSLPGKSNVLAMMVFSPDYGFDRTLQAAALAAGKHGYVTAAGSNATDSQEAALTNTFLKQHVRGVILAPFMQHSTSHYRDLIEGGIPVVLIDGIILGHVEDAVLIDNHAGMRLAVQHLVELRRRKIAYIGHNVSQNVPNQPGRRAGYLAACAEASLAVEPQWIIEQGHSDFREALIRLLCSENRPDAFVAYNDVWAIRVIRTARELGLRVPQDLSVVGFDNSAVAAEYDVPLTTIEPDHREMGIAAVEILLDEIENPRVRPKRTVLLQPQLVVRAST